MEEVKSLDDELHDIFVQGRKHIMVCLREIYEKGRADERKDFEDIEMGLAKEEARRIEQETYKRAYKEGWGKGYANGYFIGRTDAEREFQNSDYWNDYLAKVIADAKAEVIDELKPFFDAVSEYVLDWICDDLCGEFINPKTDECWCAEHCNNGTGYECIKKWCEWKMMQKGNE